MLITNTPGRGSLAEAGRLPSLSLSGYALMTWRAEHLLYMIHNEPLGVVLSRIRVPEDWSQSLSASIEDV